MSQAPQPKAAVFNTFGGLNTNADPHDLGIRFARSQRNMTSMVPGELRVRKGHASVTFQNGIASSSGNVTSMCRFDLPHARYVVFMDSQGAIRAGRNPS